MVEETDNECRIFFLDDGFASTNGPLASWDGMKHVGGAPYPRAAVWRPPTNINVHRIPMWAIEPLLEDTFIHHSFLRNGVVAYLDSVSNSRFLGEKPFFIWLRETNKAQDKIYEKNKEINTEA